MTEMLHSCPMVPALAKMPHLTYYLLTLFTCNA